MFDIKPTGESAALILSRIRRELNLHIKRQVIEKNKEHDEGYWEELISRLPQRPDFPFKYESRSSKKADMLKELERTMGQAVDVRIELASVGGQVHGGHMTKPRAKISVSKILHRHEPETYEEVENFWSSAGLDEVSGARLAEAVIAPEPEQAADNHHEHSPASREIEIWLENIQRNREVLSRSETRLEQKPRAIYRIKPKWNSWFRFNRKALVYFLAVSLVGLAAYGLVGHKGMKAKNNIVQNGNNAVANLEQAKHELEDLNFFKAADSFALAYDDLNKASGTLSQLGASFLSVFANLPGLNKVKAANNLVEVGQSLSKAGENLSLAFGTLYKTNLFSFLDAKPQGSSDNTSISRLLTEFRDILNFAEKNINRADKLLAEIDASVIPPDKQELFLNFKSQIPEFQKYIGGAIDYSDFLLNFVGSEGAKTYLVLLQNNSELRPTGGFPGSYALITFEGGSLKKIFVDDIYRADAGLKTNIIPPIPLQHITPNWGVRDANWFADFPLSARKVIELYQLGGGLKVDGVLTINPDIIARLFEVMGPIEMPEYGLTLDADNFLAEIQNEVEYEADRAAPKQILSDLQPKFFERLAQQDKDHWLEIFKIISEAAEQKHILAYFEDNDLEESATKNGMGGEIKRGPSAGSGQADYLQVVFSNVKGSKTDFVTDNSMGLTSEAVGGGTSHTLKISRVHNGGDSKYGFYNRDNSAYIKVYVPDGSELVSIQGQSITDFISLIGHEDFGFKKDPDLEDIESTIKKPFVGVDVFEESSKTVFGFWLITKPKQTKSVTIKYKVPVSVADGKYNLFWQKQSGTGNDQISFSFKVPEGKSAISRISNMQILGDNLVLNSDLLTDRDVEITLK